jgi:hypothetical protein
MPINAMGSAFYDVHRSQILPRVGLIPDQDGADAETRAGTTALTPELVDGLAYFAVFLFSSTLHEAAHAWMATRGGDLTAYHAGLGA